MSRLRDPFARLDAGFAFDPYSQPYSRLFSPRQPSARELLPEVDPATEQSTVGWMMEEALGGLGYIGSVLDKSFGARGVRGLLGGKPEELLSIIPLSDTLNLTDQSNEVTGRDLLADVGLARRRQPNEPFDWQDDLLGIGAEIALDPSTYLSLGLTGAGKAALKSAAGLAKGFVPQLKAGQRGLNFNIPFSGMESAELLSGPALARAGSVGRSVASYVPSKIDNALDAALGITPFQGIQRRVYENVGEPLGRRMNQWFTPAVKDRGTAQGQDVARDVFATEQEMERQRLGAMAERTMGYGDIAAAQPNRKRWMEEAIAAGADPDVVKTEAAVMDAFARTWALGTGKNTDDYFKDLLTVQGGTPGAGALLQEQAPIFYSKLSQVVDQKMSGPMDAAQLRKMLQNNGVKPDEMEWSGLNKLEGKLTPEQVREHLAENAVQVKEVKLGADHDKLKPIADQLKAAHDERRAYIQRLPSGVRPSQFVEVQELDQRIAALNADYDRVSKGIQDSPSTKYQQYQTPGGENYKELLLTLPEKLPEGWSVKPITDIDPEDGLAFQVVDKDGLSRGLGKTREEAIRDAHTGDIPAEAKSFRGNHWDEPNVLAHIRMNDRVVDGKKVLFVEEIQSDWHQIGRDKGYKTKSPEVEAFAKKIEELRAVRDRAKAEIPANLSVRESLAMKDDPKYIAAQEAENAVYKFIRDNEAVYEEWLNAGRGQQVPDAPFKKNWEQLAMKRVMRYAAENGYDRVSWLPGAEQAKRYDLSKQIHQMRWDTKNGSKVLVIEPKGSSTMHLVLDAEGKVVNGGEVGEDITGKMLSDVIGKEPARKILEQEKGVLKDEGLSIGGEGMKGFYDKKLVNTTNDLIKKYGAKVEQGVVPGPQKFNAQEWQGKIIGSRADGYQVLGYGSMGTFDTKDMALEAIEDHLRKTDKGLGTLDAPTFDVTPQMRDEVMKGQPLFQENMAPKGPPKLLDNPNRWWPAPKTEAEAAEIERRMVAEMNAYEQANPDRAWNDPTYQQKTKDAMAATADVNQFVFRRTPVPSDPDYYKNVNRLAQDAKGSYQVLASGQRIIRLMQGADASTFIHEVSHDFFNQLKGADNALYSDALKALGVKGDNVTVEAQEHWARGWEEYRRTGVAPSKGLQAAFDKFKDWLLNIYRSIVGTPLEGKLNPELKRVFDTMLTKGDEIPLKQQGYRSADRTADLFRAGIQSIEQADPGTLLPEIQGAAKQSLVNRIAQFHTPNDPEYADNLQNLKDWLDGTEQLNKVNAKLYAGEVTPSQQMMLEGKLPDGTPMPLDTPTVRLLNALSDQIDAGFMPKQVGDAWQLEPTEKVLGADREFLAKKMRRDKDSGPRALIDPLNDPGNVLNKSYRRNLRDWAATPGADFNDPLFFDPDYGDLAFDALEKLKATPQYQRVGKLNAAIDYKPPTGTSANDWAAKNLAPDELDKFNTLVQKDKDVLVRMKMIEQKTGAQGGWLVDSAIDYMFRQMTKFPKDDPRAKTAASFQNYFKDLKASNEAFEQRKKIFQNVPGGTTTLNDLAMDPQFSGAARTLTKEQAEAKLREILTGTNAPARGHPAYRQAVDMAEWLHGLPAEHVNDKIPFFSVDLPQLMLQRQKGMNDVQAVGYAAEQFVTRYGNDKAHFDALGRPSMSVKELAQRMNLTGTDEGGSIFAQKFFSGPVDPKQRVTLDDIKDIHVDADAARDIMTMNQAAQTPEILKPVVQMYDYLSDIMKAWLTRPFLSFHTRNMMSGLFNTWRSAGVAGMDPTQMRAVGNFLRGGKGELIKDVSSDELWKELVSGRIAFTPNSTMQSDFVGSGGNIVQQGVRRPEITGRTFAGDVAAPAREQVERIKTKQPGALNPLDRQNSLIQMMSDGGQTIEDFIRTNHYVTLRKQGWEPKAAAGEVMKYQIDYRNLTQTERSLMRRIYPWYSFSRGTLPVVLSDLVDKPGVITAPMRLVTGGRPQGEFVPGYIGEGASLPLGESAPGTARYVSSFGLPIEDEALKMLGSLVKGDLGRAGEQALGSTFPWIKSPLELIFDKQLYSGRPLSDLEEYKFASIGGLLNEKQARVLTQIIANTPASRTASTINKLMDKRKDPVTQALNLATGVRVTDVDSARAYDAAITKTLGGKLLGEPGVRSRQEIYVPLDNIQKMSPQNQLEYALYLRAEQRLRDEAKKRKQQQGK